MRRERCVRCGVMMREVGGDRVVGGLSGSGDVGRIGCI